MLTDLGRSFLVENTFFDQMDGEEPEPGLPIPFLPLGSDAACPAT